MQLFGPYSFDMYFLDLFGILISNVLEYVLYIISKHLRTFMSPTNPEGFIINKHTFKKVYQKTTTVDD